MSDRTQIEALTNVIGAAAHWADHQMRWPTGTDARARQDAAIAQLHADIALLGGLPRIEFSSEQLPEAIRAELDRGEEMRVSIPTELLGNMGAASGPATAVFTGIIDDTDPDTRVVRSMRLLRIEIPSPT
jgi:hypothetical protein